MLRHFAVAALAAATLAVAVPAASAGLGRFAGADVVAPAERVRAAVASGPSSAHRRLRSAFTVTDGSLSPKSVVGSDDGLFFAQNMMYHHNVSVFDRVGAKVATIPDTVDLAAFGVPGGAVVRGAPVEAAFTPDGRFVYVSNYKMYGPGFRSDAGDDCGRGSWDDSYVYKIDVARFRIVDVIATGSVPKHLAVSPDGTRVVVSNWCGFDVTVIDATTDTPLARVDVGRHPRGIAITRDSRYAFVAVMGEARIDVVDLLTFRVVHSIRAAAGSTPRHLLLSNDGRFLYVSNNQLNSVRKIDLGADQVVGLAWTGIETRTMALSDDGESLYVVNYRDGTVSKVRTDDMAVLQTIYSGVHPVGVTYDADTRQVWVANYTGTLRVFIDE